MKTTKKSNLRKRKVGVVGTAVLMALPVALLFWLFSDDVYNIRNVFSYVLSGRLFASQWDPDHAGYALDQPNIGKYYFLFTVTAVIVLPYVAIVRRICARRTRLEYWTFVIPTAFMCLFSLCLLTTAFYWLIQYIDAMGRTAGRSYDQLYGVAGYIVVLGFFWWAIKTPKGKEELENLSTPDTQSGAQL